MPWTLLLLLPLNVHTAPVPDERVSGKYSRIIEKSRDSRGNRNNATERTHANIYLCLRRNEQEKCNKNSVVCTNNWTRTILDFFFFRSL